MDVDRTAPAIAAAEGFIDAPVEVVWKVQADFPGWTLWNPKVERMEMKGPLKAGTVFRWKVGGASITSRLEEVLPLKRLSWTGRTLGIRAVHVWTFSPEGKGTRVRTEESFRGWFVSLLRTPMRKSLRASLEQGLDRLRAESERRARE